MKMGKSAPAPNRAALYIRVSTEEQAVHGLSIEAQREALDAWAGENRVVGTLPVHGSWRSFLDANTALIRSLVRSASSCATDNIILIYLPSELRSISGSAPKSRLSTVCLLKPSGKR